MASGYSARIVVASTLVLLTSGTRAQASFTVMAPEPLFDTAALDQALPPEVKRVLVLEAAPASPAGARAVDDLLQALARLGSAGLRVSDLPALSPADLDDKAVELCAAHDTQAVVLVEILTLEPNLSVMARLWNARGARGRTLLAPAPPPREAVGGDSQYVGLDLDGRRAWQGVTRRGLDGAAFYEAVGRGDLASSYRARSLARVLTAVGSGVAAGVGAIWWVGDALDAGFSAAGADACRFVTEAGGKRPTEDMCRNDHHDSDGPMLSFVVAGALLATAVFIPEHTLGPEQRRELARTHNRKLRADTALTVAPYVLPSAGGLTVGGRF
jgi:hypothetical protein